MMEFAFNYLLKCCLLPFLNNLAPEWFRGFSEKNAWKHVALHGNFFGPVCSTDLVKVSKDATSLLVCTRKKLFCLGSAVFLWVTS